MRTSSNATPNRLTSRAIALTVSTIWTEILSVEQPLDIDANFFDAGGDSLRLIQVRAALREKLGVEVPVADLFRYPTIFDLARHLAGTEEEPENVRTEADERAARRRGARARRAAVR